MTTFRDPVTHRVVSESTYYARALVYEAEAEAARDRVQHAADRYLEASSRRSQRYWERELGKARETLRDAQAVSMESFRTIERTERERRKAQRAAMARKRSKGSEQRPTRKAAKKAPKTLPTATEWEFGKRYDGGRGDNHNVSVNVRLVFDAPATERQAREAMRGIIDGYDPDSYGVTVEAVSWQTPKGRRRVGTQSDFESFRAIFYTSGTDYLRAGAVKDDTL